MELKQNNVITVDENEDAVAAVEKPIDNDVKKDTGFPVYLIYSKWSLTQLDEFFRKYGEAGFLRIVYDIKGKETDRTIAILPEKVYTSRCDDGYGHFNSHGFRISPFLLQEGNFPGEGRNNSLFVPVPKDWGNHEKPVVNVINDKLKHLAEWDIMDDESWNITVPLKTREKGGVKGGCFISFPNVPIERVAMIRILLTDTYWPEQSDTEERAVFRCYWARVRKSNINKSNGNKIPIEKRNKDKNPIQKLFESVKQYQKKAPVVPLMSQPTLSENVTGSKSSDGDSDQPTLSENVTVSKSSDGDSDHPPVPESESSKSISDCPLVNSVEDPTEGKVAPK